MSTDELLRGWRAGQKNLIWRGTFDEATAICALMEKQGPPKAELDITQRIHYMNVQRRKKSNSTVTAKAFIKCPKCESMVKQGHTC